MRGCSNRKCVLPAYRGFRFCAGTVCAIDKARKAKHGDVNEEE